MFVKLFEGEVPKKAYIGDAGWDCFSPTDGIIKSKEHLKISLGFAIEISKDEVAIISERSSQAIKNCITSIGNIIDSNYRGRISAILYNGSNHDYEFKKGDRICQLIVHKLGDQHLEVVDELTKTIRDSNNHGSSGV